MSTDYFTHLRSYQEQTDPIRVMDEARRSVQLVHESWIPLVERYYEYHSGSYVGGAITFRGPGECLQFWKYSGDVSITLHHLPRPRDEYWICDKYTWKLLKTCITRDLRELEKEIYEMQQAIKYHPSAQEARSLISKCTSSNYEIV